MKRIIALAIFIIVATLTACSHPGSDIIAGTGTLESPGGECTGVWLLHADSGRIYEITTIPEDFRQRDLRVRFKLKPSPGHVSGCMRGEGAEVVALSRL